MASDVDQPTWGEEETPVEEAPAPEEAPVPAESSPDPDDIVTCSLPADAVADNGEPLEELSTAGIVLTPGASVDVPRSDAAVFVEDERVEVSD